MTTQTLNDDVHELRRRLEEADETLRAIRSGEVDALVVEGIEGDRVFTLQGADHPYRVLIEAMQQGAVSMSGDGTILYCNRCFADMLKTPHEKVIGASVSRFLPASQQASFAALVGQELAPKNLAELQFQAADGTLLPVLIGIAPLPLADAVAMCMVVTDLTEQKKHHVLQVENRRKDEFLAMLAHELRNPLAPIRNAVAIVEHLGIADDRLTSAQEIIQRQVHQLSRLVDDLLDISRITLGKVKLQKEPVDLETILASAVETSQSALEAKQQRLTISLPPNALRIEADPARLVQVIGNLLTNAAKYTDGGGEIVMSAEREGEEIVIQVRDTGMGISAELLPRVFDLFTQGDRSLDRSDGGLGIGLTLVRRLVEMHGGSVQAHSDGPGKGSVFVVRLPGLLEEIQAKSASVPPPLESNGSVGRRVLIVEDNRDGAESLAMLLGLMGHSVRTAYTGLEAIEKANAVKPEVILLDIGLPGLNGYEVAKRLRQLPEFEATVLVALTGYGQEEDKARSREAGFNHHFIKPINPQVLQKLLESIDSTIA